MILRSMESETEIGRRHPRAPGLWISNWLARHRFKTLPISSPSGRAARGTPVAQFRHSSLASSGDPVSRTCTGKVGHRGHLVPRFTGRHARLRHSPRRNCDGAHGPGEQTAQAPSERKLRLNSATGTSVNLSSLATDPGGAASLTYTWVSTAVPARASAPVFTINDSNAAKNTTARLTASGTYQFKVIIADSAGRTITSSVRVRVPQRFTGVTISPQSICMAVGGTQQFTATARDQFGKPMAPQPGYRWKTERRFDQSPRSLSCAPVDRERRDHSHRNRSGQVDQVHDLGLRPPGVRR